MLFLPYRILPGQIISPHTIDLSPYGYGAGPQEIWLVWLPIFKKGSLRYYRKSWSDRPDASPVLTKDPATGELTRAPKPLMKALRAWLRDKMGREGRTLRFILYRSRFVALEHGLVDKLSPELHIHHKDRDTTNDDPRNLQPLDQVEHALLHIAEGDIERYLYLLRPVDTRPRALKLKFLRYQHIGGLRFQRGRFDPGKATGPPE
jgi:hypothetical protein